MKIATFAAGCFWGVEEAFISSNKVISTRVGYTGGKTVNPTYKQVCNGDTGHAEAVEVTFDPIKANFQEMLEIFWRIHDPTTLNRQKWDIGEQYRSAIFYHDNEQESLAKQSVPAEQTKYKYPIVTQILPATEFYPAEEYHQQYIRKTGKNVCH